MTFDAICLSLAFTAIVFAVICLPFFRALNEAPQTGARCSTIDGLRGFLAFGVFIFHYCITREFIQTGMWEVPQERFFALLGPVPVSIFFMITGFLFWQKVLRAQGHIKWRSLYIGRLFRIAPLYLFVVGCMLVIVFARTGWQLNEPLSAVIVEVLQWLALGVFYTQTDVNGYGASHVLAGVTWTIAYEWAFYASLIVTAIFVRKKWEWYFLIGALCVIFASKLVLRLLGYQAGGLGFAALFIYGMSVASLLHRSIRLPISERWSSVAASLLLVVVLATARTGYESISGVLLAGFFYLICSGATLFGLLTSQGAHRLGNISYSIYLTQGLILTAVFAWAPIKYFALASGSNYWLTGILCAVLLVLASTLSYLVIEKPGIALGRRVAKKTWPQASALPVKTTREPEAIALAEKFPSY